MARYSRDRKSNPQYGGTAFYMKAYTSSNGKTYWKGKSKNGKLSVTMFELDNQEWGEYRIEVFGIGNAIRGASKGGFKQGIRKAKQGNDNKQVVYVPQPPQYNPGQNW